MAYIKKTLLNLCFAKNTKFPFAFFSDFLTFYTWQNPLGHMCQPSQLGGGGGI